mgnify:CR=1 FL=1
MLLENSHIYPYIKGCMEKVSVVKISSGNYISRAENVDKQLYYILSGTVKVVCMAPFGKKVLVDVISENEFAGQISYVRNVNLYCDSVALTDVELLCLENELIDELMANNEFSTFFYFKTSSRIYQMYKKMLVSNLFSQSELVAYHIVDKAQNGKFIYKSIYDMCENLNISRKNLYNILNDFESKGVIEKEQNGVLLIKDNDYLKKESDKVKMFFENEY